MDVVLQVGNVLVLVAAAIATASVVVHATVTPPWWSSAIGRHLMAYMAAMAAVLLMSSARIIAGATLDAPWYVILRTVVFAAVPLAMGWRLWIQMQLHRWVRDPRQAGPPPNEPPTIDPTDLPRAEP